MTADLLRRAIDKLEGLRDDARAFDWRGYERRDGVAFGVDEHLIGEWDGDMQVEVVLATHRRELRDLVLGLHATIDAQLAILRNEWEFLTTPFVTGLEVIPDEHVIALARSILGEES